MKYNESTIATYERILEGKQKSFSPYFFQPQHRNTRCMELIKYLVEKKLQITPEEALEELNLEILKEYKLDCILKYVDKPVEFMDDNVSHLIYFAYPEIEKPSDEELAVLVYKDVLDGKRRSFPRNYFLNGELGERRAIACFKHLCENILKLDQKGILKTFDTSQGLKVLSKYKLKILMNILFFSTFDLLETAYPGILESA